MRAENFQSFYEMFNRRVELTPTTVFASHKSSGVWHHLTWSDGSQRIIKTARALASLGFKPSDRVCIISNTNLEWILTDFAVLYSGGVTVSIYQSLLATEIEYMINLVEAPFVFVEDQTQVKKMSEIRANLKSVKKVVVFKGESSADGWIVSWQDFLSQADRTNEATIEAWGQAVQKSDLATMVFTSGTTPGPVKSAMLLHQSLTEMTKSLALGVPVSVTDKHLLFLPLAHILARILAMASVRVGYTTVVCESIDKIVDNLGETHPTFMTSVPRIYEKMFSRITGQAKEAGGIKEKIFQWSVRVGRQVSQLKQANKAIPLSLGLQHKLADKLVYSKIKKTFGGNIRFFISGGAALSLEIAEFFHAMDMLILEGYGMTETCGVTNVNRPDAYKFGTVGPVLPGIEQKIAPDGEILVRGATMTPGYYKRDDATRDTIDAEGWLHTGDIGVIDEQGFLKITDRKKDIIVTAGGKNIAPQNVENIIKAAEPISQIMVYGEKRKYITALVTLDPEPTAKFAKANNLLTAEEAKQLIKAGEAALSPSLSEKERLEAAALRHSLITKICDAPALKKWVEDAIAEQNKKLANFEAVKRFRIIPAEFSIATGELTPSLKMKRKVIIDKYKDVLDSMYNEKFD